MDRRGRSSFPSGDYEGFVPDITMREGDEIKLSSSTGSPGFEGFDDAERMKSYSYYNRTVDEMEEVVRFRVLLRPDAARLVVRVRNGRMQACRSTV